MLSLRPTPSTQERPQVIVVVAVLCGGVSLISVVLAILLIVGAAPLSAGASLLGGGLEQMGPVAFLIYGAILALLGVALSRRWPWARRAAIGLAAAGIALSIPALSSAVVDERVWGVLRNGSGIILRVVIIYYLSQEPVKEWFSSR